MSVVIPIPVNLDNPYPLGRHIEHDPRSRGFAVVPTASAGHTDKVWSHYIPVLDQSDLRSQGIFLSGEPDALSSCTGNAGIGVIGTLPFWMKQVPSLRRQLKNAQTAETYAVDLYASATELDEFPDTYPPTDNGSSGLGVAKAMVNLGYIRSYDHVFDGVTGMITALQDGPVMMGVNWYESMFTPKPDGTIDISGAVAGGHEFTVDAVYIQQRLFRCVNSWTPEWGDKGCFFMSFDQSSRLLGEQGDIVVPRF